MALARASGLGGMVGGQMLDLAAEGRFDGGKRQTLGEQGVATLQAMKTGALLALRLRRRRHPGAGERRASAPRSTATATSSARRSRSPTTCSMSKATAATLGKAAGKDAEAGKATLVAVLGIDKAKARLKTLVADAEAVAQAVRRARRGAGRSGAVRRGAEGVGAARDSTAFWLARCRHAAGHRSTLDSK